MRESPKVASKVSPIWTGVMSQSWCIGVQWEKPAVFFHTSHTDIAGPLKLKMGRDVTKNLNFEHPVFFSFLHDCTADAGTLGAKMREDQHFENIFACLRCTLSLDKRHILKT